MSWLQEAKLVLLGLTGLSKDALHIYVGLAVFLLAIGLGRWRLGDWPPLLIVAAIAIAGEAWDLLDNIRTDAPMQWAGHWKDIGNTLVWPGVFTAIGRWTQLFRPER